LKIGLQSSPNTPSKSLLTNASIYFYVISKLGYNGSSKRLKQVWALGNGLVVV